MHVRTHNLAYIFKMKLEINKYEINRMVKFNGIKNKICFTTQLEP